MKESVGEGAMTVITIALVAGAIGAIVIIISGLLTNQGNRARCENAGGTYKGGSCVYYSGNIEIKCEIIDDEYICG